MSSSESPPGATDGTSALVGARLADRFRLTRPVSTGANTVLYDAVDDETGRAVTVKVLRPQLAASPSFRDRFDDTMRGVAALSHPNIAAVYGWGLTAVGSTSTAYVVIEHLTGGSLRDLFDRARRLSPSQALAVGLDVCRGLDHAHRRGFVHTELTPSKLVFGDDRRLRIVDFGLARLLGEPVWSRPESVDNHVAWYSAPEQGLMRPIDGKADVYALCLTLHEAVTGELPFRSDSTVSTLAARVGKLMPVSADLGPLAAVLERAGRPEADERSSAAEFGKDLVQTASKLPRPEPLPLLSSGLFDRPVDELRAPDDPTGGITRPHSESGADQFDVAPGDGEATLPIPTIVAADPDDIPRMEPGDELVILPLDTDVRPGITTTDDGTILPTSEQVTVDRNLEPTRRMPASAATPAVAPPTVRNRAGRSRSWKLLLGLVVLAALAVLGVLATQLFRTPVYTVPDLTDTPRAEALNIIAPNGWVIEEQRERSDVVPTVDRIVRTTPRAGAELAEGEPFLIVVSDGPMLRELPDSTGATLADAQTRLLERGLQVEVVEVDHEEIPAGTVVSWTVPGDATLGAGVLVEPETLVQLVVSRGPAPRVVPDLAGSAIGDASRSLDDLRLVIDVVGEEFSDDVPSGDVIRQEPAAGSEVDRGATVAVVVSKGVDLVVFPELSGAVTYEEAAELLLEAGFVPRLRFGDAQGVIRDVSVDGEEPAAGDSFRRGTEVDISAL